MGETWFPPRRKHSVREGLRGLSEKASCVTLMLPTMARRLLIALLLGLALPASASAGLATIESRDLPLHGERSLASAGSTGPFQLVGLHWEGPGRLELRVRTFYGNGGVMAPGVQLGPEQLARDDHERRGIRAAFLVALFAFAGFFHLVLFTGRQRERHHLWFALFCFALGCVTAGINTLGYLLSGNPDFNAYLVFVPIITLPHLVIQFWSTFFDRPNVWWERVTPDPEKKMGVNLRMFEPAVLSAAQVEKLNGADDW